MIFCKTLLLKNITNYVNSVVFRKNPNKINSLDFFSSSLIKGNKSLSPFALHTNVIERGKLFKYDLILSLQESIL